MTYSYSYRALPGILWIYADENKIKNISSQKEAVDSVEQETPLIRAAHLQLEEYFNGNRKSFDLPLDPDGTSFQKKVWNALLNIPYGQTRTYKQIAGIIGNPNAARAVGMANNKNPIMIVIPCHRVIGADGSLTGYAGGIDIKEKLINLEKGQIGP